MLLLNTCNYFSLHFFYLFRDYDDNPVKQVIETKFYTPVGRSKEAEYVADLTEKALKYYSTNLKCPFPSPKLGFSFDCILIEFRRYYWTA